ncbi:alkaline shock response membrane anchor protein AmaP [Streptomyces sp. NPDC059753]|uniref:alkaline shock response membrane anchor protein AmaP n=1 Tax=Streptomyces sp. NPDC059753 TaxID=3346933 RepID=UPI00366391EB
MTPKSAVNRTLLTLAGLILLGGGLLILAAGLNLYRNWNLTPPTGWPLTGPHDVLLSRADRTHYTDQGWWWPTLIATLALILVAALWWLIAQRRTRAPRHLHVGTPPQDAVELHGRALTEVLATDTARLPDVHKAQARITGHHDRHRADLALTLTPDADPARLLNTLQQGPLTRAQRAAGWPQLTTHARLRITPHHPRRAE